ncbi:MAG: tetratricopeptide repeat protein, partial [Candidatus Binataceae bacterium]
LGWAMTQNSLGSALEKLGEREPGTARLDEAVAAFREALKERTRQRVPLDWAMTQNNLGGALERLGERESGTARLEEAVAAYREALKEYTRERVPLQWATTQSNLGAALGALGGRESDASIACEALDCHVSAWEVFSEGAPHQASVAANGAGRDIAALKKRFEPTAYQQCLARHSDALKRMSLL